MIYFGFRPDLIGWKSFDDRIRVSAGAKKFDEGEALRTQATAESLRMAAQKYEEALQLWRAISARAGALGE